MSLYSCMYISNIYMYILFVIFLFSLNRHTYIYVYVYRFICTYPIWIWIYVYIYILFRRVDGLAVERAGYGHCTRSGRSVGQAVGRQTCRCTYYKSNVTCISFHLARCSRAFRVAFWKGPRDIRRCCKPGHGSHVRSQTSDMQGPFSCTRMTELSSMTMTHVF